MREIGTEIENDGSRAVTRRELFRTGALSAFAAAMPAIVPAAALGRSAPTNRVNVAVIGLGSQGQRLLNALLRLDTNIVAVCDVDSRQIAHVRKSLGLHKTAAYSDYRTLLHREKYLDAVAIATPDHWHLHLCKAAIHAGKHVYCEKPLARTVGEARLLRDISRNSKVVTQMGNQGSAYDSFRRCVEIIQAGAIGQVAEVHVYVPGGRFPRGIDLPPGGGGAPRGLDWDFWVGPARSQGYHEHLFHPFEWRGWYRFGGGQLGDFGCHSLNLPVRALDLGYPDRIEVTGRGLGKQSYFIGGEVRMQFPARGDLIPVTIYWYDDINPPADVFREVVAVYGEVPSGVLIIGDSGSIFTSPHNTDGILKLPGDMQFMRVTSHPGVRDIPVQLPRVGSHQEEWINACKGHGRTFSPFETGGQLTEIVQAGVLALHLGQSIDWDGPAMEVAGVPSAAAMILPAYRTRYML